MGGEPDQDARRKLVAETVTALARIFARIHVDAGTLDAWLAGLAPLSDDEVRLGLRRALQGGRGSWQPTPGDFRAYARGETPGGRPRQDLGTSRRVDEWVTPDWMLEPAENYPPHDLLGEFERLRAERGEA